MSGVIDCSDCTTCARWQCAKLDTLREFPEYRALRDERDQLLRDLASARETIDELRAALDTAIADDMKQKDEVAMQYLEQLHDAKSVIRLLVRVL